MSDVVDTGVSVDTGTTTAVDVPEVAPSPANDPAPAETPAAPEPVVAPPQPEETPVIEVPKEVPPQPAQASQAPAPISIKDRAYAALEKIRFNKRRKLDKILQLAATKKSIKNDDVQLLLRVSDATATNYLSALVLQGKLKRLGSTSHATYEPV